MGYGAIGRQTAHIAHSLGMEVYGHTRSERNTAESRKDDSFVVAGTGDPDGLIPAKWFSGDGVEAVNDFLAQDLDVLVLCLPLTETSRGIIGRQQLEILSKRHAFISNISRGKLIDTDALIESLETDKIRGAALDVTDPEPLTDGHPLWTTKNVFVSPHVSWQTPR